MRGPCMTIAYHSHSRARVVWQELGKGNFGKVRIGEYGDLTEVALDRLIETSSPYMIDAVYTHLKTRGVPKGSASSAVDEVAVKLLSLEMGDTNKDSRHLQREISVQVRFTFSSHFGCRQLTPFALHNTDKVDRVFLESQLVHNVIRDVEVWTVQDAPFLPMPLKEYGAIKMHGITTATNLIGKELNRILDSAMKCSDL